MPSPGRGADLGGASVPAHAPDDGLSHAAAVGGDRSLLEAGPAVAHVDRRAAVLELAVEGDGPGVGGELGGVHHRLACGGDDGLGARVERRVTDDHRLHRDAVGVLDLDRGALQRRRDPGAVRRLAAAAEPGPQLALLAAGEVRDLARVVGALLHQGQRLQDGVVEVGAELGALLGADPRVALGGEVAAQPPQERREDQAEGGDRDDHREDHVARRLEGAVRVEEEDRRADHEGDAEAAPVEGPRPLALRADGRGGRPRVRRRAGSPVPRGGAATAPGARAAPRRRRRGRGARRGRRSTRCRARGRRGARRGRAGRRRRRPSTRRARRRASRRAADRATGIATQATT